MEIYNQIKHRYPTLFTTTNNVEKIEELINQKQFCEALFVLAEFLELMHLPQEAQHVLEYANAHYSNPWTLANLTKHHLAHDQIQYSTQLINKSSLSEDQKYLANALILQRQKNYRDALDRILKHCQKYPEDQSSRLELARTFVQYGLPIYGLEQIDSISDYSEADVDVTFVKAAALLRLYRVEEAEIQYETVLEGNHPEAIKCRAFLGLARCNSMLGQVSEAVQLLQKVIDTKDATTSQRVEAVFELSKLNSLNLEKTVKEIDVDIESLQDQFLLEWVKSAVAKNDCSTDEYVKSLIHANNIRFRDFCPEQRDTYLLNIEHYIEKLFSKYDQFVNDIKPVDLPNKFIFIIGMPRSGTTVLEQTLGSNSAVTQLGETTYISLALDFFINEEKPSICDLQTKLSSFFSSHTINKNQIITEKTPFNFLWIGFINKLFPGALVVLIERDKIDTKVSNFIQPFTAIPLKYSFDWQCLCGYYSLYERIIEMWTIRNARFKHVRYDDLVTNPAQIMEAFASYLDVSTETLSVMDPSANRRPISTASMYQASKKIEKVSNSDYQLIYKILESSSYREM